MQHSTANQQDDHRGHKSQGQEAGAGAGNGPSEAKSFIGLRAEGLGYVHFWHFRVAITVLCRRLDIELESIAFTEHHSFAVGREVREDIWAYGIFQPCEAEKAFNLRSLMQRDMPGVEFWLTEIS